MFEDHYGLCQILIVSPQTTLYAHQNYALQFRPNAKINYNTLLSLSCLNHKGICLTPASHLDSGLQIGAFMLRGIFIRTRCMTFKIYIYVKQHHYLIVIVYSDGYE